MASVGEVNHLLQETEGKHPLHGQEHTQLVCHSATLQGWWEGRWAGGAVGDAIHQVRESRDVCRVNCQLMTVCKTTGLGNSFGPMKFNDSHVKQTSLHFVGNANHMKVASNSIGPCDCHVT